MSWLNRFLFTHARATQPDGRPLYGYKILDRYYAELLALISHAIGDYERNQSAPELPALFCLYAAETFRREHVDGSWTWQTIFTPLNVDVPPNPITADWVERGLQYWQRPLLSNRRSNLYLMTIACEGGLPLRLLARENTHLTTYFRAILDQYYRTAGNQDTAVSIAQQHAQRLPKSLQQMPVFQLAGQLIVQISALQPYVSQAADPIAVLNQHCPNWERQLPMRLDDNNATALLRLLVTRSNELAAERNAHFEWRGQLRHDGAQWHVEKQLQLPELIDAAQLFNDQLNSATAPRYRLLLQMNGDNTAVAWLTRMKTAAGAAQYRREWLHSGGVRLTDVAVCNSHALALHDGATATPLPVDNGDRWGDVPWVFVEQTATSTRRWLTEGSAQLRAEQAWVVAPATFTIDASAGSCDPVGECAAVARLVYRISGMVDFVTPQHDRYRLRCRAAQDLTATVAVIGATLPLSGQQQPLYRGLPQLRAQDAAGHALPEAQTWRLQWKPVGRDIGWQASQLAPRYGQLWLRLVDAENCERGRRHVTVVPRSLHIKTTIGAGKQAGVIQFTGLTGAQVTCSLATVQLQCGDDDAQLQCPPVTGHTPPPFTVQLTWAGADAVVLTLPYPQRGACFLRHGTVVSAQMPIALERLGAVQLRIQDAGVGGSHWLVCELVTGARQPAGRHTKQFRDRLPALHDGQLDMALWSWQPRLDSLLATVHDLDAQVKLTVETGGGERLAQLLVTRFDGALTPDRVNHQVFIAEDGRVHWGSDPRQRCQMIPLWAPARDPIPLTAADDGWRWQVPAQLEPGPWWILGYDGDWARCRPLLWTVFADANAAPNQAEQSTISPLAAAIQEFDGTQRTAKLQQVLAALATAPDDPDWALLFDIMRLARHYPPQALEALRHLSSQPHTLALTLFKADDDLFEIVWNLAQQMPFSWALIGIDVWLAAATAHVNALRAALQDSALEPDVQEALIFDSFQTFRARITQQRGYWAHLCDWLQERLFPQHPLKASELTLLRRVADDSPLAPLVTAELLALQARHAADEHWADSAALLTAVREHDLWLPAAIKPEPHYSAAVRYAPFIAAQCSLHGIATDEWLIYELRILRHFDCDWFDAVYAIALSRGLARIPVSSN